MLNQRHKYLLPSQNMLFHVQPILQFWQKRHDCYYFNPSYDILSQIFAESYLLMNEFYCIKTTESEHPKYQYIILIISNLTRHSIFKILQASRNINENTFIFKIYANDLPIAVLFHVFCCFVMFRCSCVVLKKTSELECRQLCVLRPIKQTLYKNSSITRCKCFSLFILR